ncbi:MAG: D-3-phosphoglycerate dehydrogenase [uncultured Thermomicrobiales bacterium]|uniref:D-3-phosphoglycerate dehydrogenase n=1 Tax=uncultured Thermomicrobiales bacterium TaxID=1645740 RepID=A0A6J4VI25_9BACT|nr:MAG: D-3-phosphoglycerate dehydrogenase [uncultured Thermomicrobiales bacterium]
MASRDVRVVITSDRFYGTGTDIERSIAERYPGLAVEVETLLAPDDDTMIAVAHGADAIVTASIDAVPRRVIEALPGLRVIGRYAVGYDNIDLDAAQEHGVVVTHYPGYCTDEVADHALSLILALNRRLVPSDRRLREGHWVGHSLDTAFVAGGEIWPLREQTIGVVGFGRIGRAVVARLQPFGCRIVVADPYVDPTMIQAAGPDPVSLEDLIMTSDVVTIHCPLTPGTRHLFGPEQFRAMRPGSMLVNTARGPIVDGAALAAALRAGHLQCAALDVMEHEPVATDDPLLQTPNLIVTPHSAYYSERSMEVLRRETYVDVLAVLAGGTARTTITPARVA